MCENRWHATPLEYPIQPKAIDKLFLTGEGNKPYKSKLDPNEMKIIRRNGEVNLMKIIQATPSKITFTI